MAKIRGVSANYKLLIWRKNHNKFYFNEIDYKICYSNLTLVIKFKFDQQNCAINFCLVRN